MKKPIVIGFYGESNTGKTYLITRLIKRFTDEKFNVGTVKISDKNIGIDTEGKDTYEHSRAGAKLVVFSSPVETDFLFKQNQTIYEILNNINRVTDCDIIFVEGAHDIDIPKIKIGTIKERNNTIYSYSGDFEDLIKMIKKMLIGG